MDRDELVRRLMATFLAELEEHRRSLERDLLALEQGPPAEGRAQLLRTLLRTAHSLKGASRSVDATPISAACHWMEEVLSGLRDERTPASSELFQQLFSVVDMLDDAGTRLREGRSLHDAPISSALRALPVAHSSLPPTADRSGSSVHELAEEAPRSMTPKSSAADGLVRISAKKLDSLVRRSGELLVARRKLATHHEEIHLAHEQASRSLRELRSLEQSLRAGATFGYERGDDTETQTRIAATAVRVREDFQRLESRLERLTTSIARAQRATDHAAAALEDEVHRARMVQLSEAWQGMHRLVRDLATTSGKEVELSLEGGQVEVDRTVLEGLRDPLLHLVRNAVVHGVEPPEVRLSAGKPRRARIQVCATLLSSGVELVVEDDGCGIDIEAVRRQADRMGIALHGDTREVARLVFFPGLTTSHAVTEMAGRGVGLDVVKGHVEGIHGRVDVSSAPGKGARFVIHVPLTLGRLRALLVRAGGQVFAIADTNIARLRRVGSSDVAIIDGREALVGGERPLPVAALAEVLHLPHDASSRIDATLPAVIVSAGHREMALIVDELLDDHELVIETLGRRLHRVRGIAGASILPTGGIALLLSVGEVIRAASEITTAGSVASSFSQTPPERPRRILVVDDSLTTRTLERTVLESVGYQVIVAGDGEEAWRLLHEHEVDLVVSDVEMPRMDGFALTQSIRRSQRLAKMPVVLVTALASERDRERGAEAGASAYLVKSSFDQTALLTLVDRLV